MVKVSERNQRSDGFQECSNPKSWIRINREEDELSTSAGSGGSDVETEPGTPVTTQVKAPEEEVAPRRSLLFVFFNLCSRRKPIAPPTRSPQRREEREFHIPSAEDSFEICAPASESTSAVPQSIASTNEQAPPATDLFPVSPHLLVSPTFRPPPGLPPPPGIEFLLRLHGGSEIPSQAVPGIAQVPQSESTDVISDTFSPVRFHRDVVVILRDLALDRNTGRAVQRVREQHVPSAYHAAEFADLLTRAMETKSGMVRRSMIAFSAGLAAGENSAFDRAQCAEGLKAFLRDVYPELCIEVPKLPALITSELLPTLQQVFPPEQLKRLASRLKLRMRQ